VRIFLTGASSPLGELVVPRLAATHDVVALARSSRAAELAERRGARVVLGSIEEPSSWGDDARQADAVVHLAGMRFAEAVAAHVGDLQPLTVIGSASARNPAHPLSSALRLTEEALRVRKPRALVVLRPTMIYGATGDKTMRLLARAIARVPAVPRFIGGGRVQPVFADDVADAIFATVGHTGRLEADLGGPAAVRLGELVFELARLLDRRVIPIPVPVLALTRLSAIASRIQTSRGLHALDMLRHDRAVTTPDGGVVEHTPIPLRDGLTIAVGRYRAAGTL